MEYKPWVYLVAAFLGSAAFAALINGIFAIGNKKRDQDIKVTEERVQDQKAAVKKSEERIEKLERELDEMRREFASWKTYAASLDQYAAALEVIIRRIDPSAMIPPRPSRERK